MTRNEVKYTLKAKDSIVVPDENKKVIQIVKWCIMGACLSIILISFILRYLVKFPVWIIGLAVIIALVSLLIQTKKQVATPFEIYFYEDYLILCHPQRYYSKTLAKKDLEKIKYAEIKKCIYQENLKCIFIQCISERMSFEYDNTGNISEKPTYRKESKHIATFSTVFADGIDFVNEIQSHSPIKVSVQKFGKEK